MAKKKPLKDVICFPDPTPSLKNLEGEAYEMRKRELATAIKVLDNYITDDKNGEN